MEKSNEKETKQPQGRKTSGSQQQNPRKQTANTPRLEERREINKPTYMPATIQQAPRGVKLAQHNVKFIGKVNSPKELKKNYLILDGKHRRAQTRSLPESRAEIFDFLLAFNNEQNSSTSPNSFLSTSAESSHHPASQAKLLRAEETKYLELYGREQYQDMQKNEFKS